ncbi:gene transfer agent family protein [Bosea sp. LjRoot237]|uniref:gene transfer agent family protein n=1 Tax=Bosea sp. LjRoot237 TaxID=3342292 RepID=UPI003ECE8E2E
MAFENRNGRIELDFADGTYGFRLAIGELEELQEKTGVGPYTLLRRLLANDWRVEDVTHTIRLGLIGDGCKPTDALNLVRRYIEQRSEWLHNAMLAQAIVSAALVGAPEEVPGKDSASEDETGASNFQTDASPSASSTGQQEQQE